MLDFSLPNCQFCRLYVSPALIVEVYEVNGDVCELKRLVDVGLGHCIKFWPWDMRHGADRKHRRDQAIYGVFLSESDSSASDGPSGRKRSRNVSVSENESSSDEGAMSSDNAEEYEESVKSRLFSKLDRTKTSEVQFVTSTVGPQVPSAAPIPVVSIVEGFSSSSDDSSDKETDMASPPVSRRPPRLTAKEIFGSKRVHSAATAGSSAERSSDAAFSKEARETHGQPSSAGKFEKQYGIGFTLLSKMGYQGGGLGAEGQGRTSPLEIQMRSKQKGLQENESRSESSAAAARAKIGKRTAMEGAVRYREWQRKKHLREKYKDELAALYEERDATFSAPLIDMRSATVTVHDGKDIGRIWSSDSPPWSVSSAKFSERLHEIDTNSSPPAFVPSVPWARFSEIRAAQMIDEDEALQRLTHVRAVVQDCLTRVEALERDQSQKAQVNRKLMEQYCQPLTIESEMDEWNAAEERIVCNGHSAKPAAAESRTSEEPHKITLAELTKTVEKLQAEYAHEVAELDVKRSISFSVLIPVMRDFALTWSITDDPTNAELARALSFWESFVASSEDMSLIFDKAVNQSAIEPFFQKLWDPKSDADLGCQISQTWLAKWLTPTTYQTVLTETILARLLREVEEWDPASAALRPDLWLHQWLEFVPQESKWGVLWHTLLRKFTSALVNWEPTDRSAQHLLLPWRELWQAKLWPQLIRVVEDQIAFWLGRQDDSFTDPEIPVTLAQAIDDWEGSIKAESVQTLVLSTLR